MGASHGKTKKMKYKPQRVEAVEKNVKRNEGYNKELLTPDHSNTTGEATTSTSQNLSHHPENFVAVATREPSDDGGTSSTLGEDIKRNNTEPKAEQKLENGFNKQKIDLDIHQEVTENRSNLSDSSIPEKGNSIYLLESSVPETDNNNDLLESSHPQRGNNNYLLESNDSATRHNTDLLELSVSETSNNAYQLESSVPETLLIYQPERVSANVSHTKNNSDVAEEVTRVDAVDELGDYKCIGLSVDAPELHDNQKNMDSHADDNSLNNRDSSFEQSDVSEGVESISIPGNKVETSQGAISLPEKSVRFTNNITNGELNLEELSTDSEDGEPCIMIIPKRLSLPKRQQSHPIAESSRQESNSVRMRYKVRSSSDSNTVPPLPPRQTLLRNERDNAPGINRRQNQNALSMVLPLAPSRRVSRRNSERFWHPKGESRDTEKSPSKPLSHEDRDSPNVVNILPLPPKSKALTLANDTGASPAKRFTKKNNVLNPRENRLLRSGSFAHKKEKNDNHLPRRPQTLYRDQFDGDDTQFVCLLDLPLKNKGSIVSPEKLTEKNVHDLLTAAKKGETDYVRTLLTKINININVSDQDGMTALHYACRSGNPDTVSLLIDWGACINAKTIYGTEPLMIALREKPEIETARKWHQRDVAQVIHELICAGASLHSSDVDGLSTLLVAASVENNYTVDYLLDNGADVNFPLQFRSLLHVISIQVSRGISWIEIERKMLENGADPNVVDCCGNTPASLLFYSEFTPFTVSDVKDYTLYSSNSDLEFEKYMELPSVLRLGKPNKNTFGYTRKRLQRLLRHLRAGLDINKMPQDMMLQLDKFLLREQNEDVLRLFHSCGHYPSIATLQEFIPNQVANFTELWELLEMPATLMLTAASVVRVNTRPSAYIHAKSLPLPKSIIPYITLDTYEEIFKPKNFPT